MILAAVALFVMMALAFANGANDNCRGVATLIGSGRVTQRTGLWIGHLTTFAGALLACAVGHGLLRAFSGHGLLADHLAAAVPVLMIVGIAAAATIFLCTVLALPVSTTHTLMGSLLGAGIVLAPADVGWGTFGARFVAPLLIGPALAAGITLLAILLVGAAIRRLHVTEDSCLCLTEGESCPVHSPAGTQAMAMSAVTRLPRFVAGKWEYCRSALGLPVPGVTMRQLVDGLHFFSAGLVSFARGLNDTPKIAAVGIAVALPPWAVILTAGLAMLLGGILGGRPVAATMSHRIAGMQGGHGTATTGNMVTGLLVTAGSAMSLPLSTTHVSCGSIFGVGLVRRSVVWSMAGGILLAWVTVVPLSAALAAGLALGMRFLV